MKHLFRFNSGSTVPNIRMLFYLVLLGTVPVLLALTMTFSQQRRLRSYASEMEQITASALVAHRKGRLNRLVRAQFQGADRFFLDQNLETLRFLESERQLLRSLVEQDPSLPDAQVMSRLEFIEGDANRLVFSEGSVQSFGDVRETIESLVHPVELTASDLQTLLACIEAAEGRPQLIVSDFEIRRRESKRGNEVFQLDMKLIKREYTCES